MAKTLSKSIIQTILTQIPTQLFGIVSGVFITRILTTDNRGVYAILMANVSLFLTLFGFSMSTAIIYFLASKKLELKQVLGLNILSFFLFIGLSLLSIFTLYYFDHIDVLFLDSFSKGILLWFLSYLSLVHLNSVYSGIFQSNKEFGIVNRVSFLNGVFNIVIYGALFIIDYLEIYKAGLSDVLTVNVIVLAMNFLQWNFHFSRMFNYQITFQIDYKKHLKDLVHYLGLAHLSNIISFFNGRIVLWVLAIYLDNYQIGIFSVALGLSQILSFVSLPLSQVLLPFLTSENQEERERLFIIFSKLHFTIIVILSLFGMLVSPYLIPMLYGAQYEKSLLPFFIMIIGFVFNSQTRIISAYMFSSNKVIINLYGTLIGFVSTIFFYFVLIEKYGIKGAAISTTLTYTSIFTFTYFILARTLKNQGRNFLFLSKSDFLLIKNKIKLKR